MTSHDIRNDPVLAALGDLPACDVDEIRAHRLRRRCRAVLTAKPRGAIAASPLASLPWRRVLGPAVVAMWTALYVLATLQQAIAIFRP
ncbi:MAG TPA: hypothetical protein VD833_00900 [Vicinamibacterales bacterium]|nr:hypothetical protein [Vicinamibacterales bacterium]